MQKHLVVGMGEVGKAIYAVLDVPDIEVVGLDLDSTQLTDQFDVLHICFTYSEAFFMSVTDYQKRFLVKDGLTIIHSTVPPGTSEKVNAVHSPVRGVHPNLEEGVRTFVKFFGGKRADEGVAIFEKLGIKTKKTYNSRDTEVGKILSTTKYGIDIIAMRMFARICNRYGVDIDLALTEFTETYNEGYQELGKGHFTRPVLYADEGPIGGHCVKQNLRFLKGQQGKNIQRFILDNE